MNLPALVLSAILMTLPATADQAAERARLDPLAAAIAAAVLAAPALPFEGPAAREASALGLVALAAGESGWRAEVIDCRVTGDHGRSVSAWQLMTPWAWAGRSRADICSSVPLAAGLALRALGLHGAQARSHLSMFYGYASGSASRPSKAGRAHCLRWERLARRAGLVASCWNKAPITKKEGAESPRPLVPHDAGAAAGLSPAMSPHPTSARTRALP